MRFTIFDVGHGFSAYLVADNGNIMLFDCGHKTDPEFRPSDFLSISGCTAIERFLVTNYDEDHISDLPNLRKKFPISRLSRNVTMSPDQLQRVKQELGPLSEAMKSLLQMMRRYTSDPTPAHPDFPDITWQTFRHQYPFAGDSSNTNNISLVSFIHYHDIHLVIPGDLGKPAWEKFLGNGDFLNNLSKVNFFIASHHGRKDGYSSLVFEYCNPSLVIFSDGPLTHTTQEMANTYGAHARGVRFGNTIRRVVTTRNDGMITISQEQKGNVNVNLEKG